MVGITAIGLRINKWRRIWTPVAAFLGLIVLLAGLYALGTAEREWPSVAKIDFNLEYGPLPPSAAAEQSLGAVPEPLTKAAVWFKEPRPGMRAIIRILQSSSSGLTVLFEQFVDIEPSGRAVIEIPSHIPVVGSGIIIQAVNPRDSRGSIHLQANRIDGYPSGQASINGDIGGGTNDLVMQLWRRSTPRSVLTSMLGASAAGVLFLAATAAVCSIGIAWISRSAARRVGGALPEVAAVALLIGGSIAWTLFGIFTALEPWTF